MQVMFSTESLEMRVLDDIALEILFRTRVLRCCVIDGQGQPGGRHRLPQGKTCPTAGLHLGTHAQKASLLLSGETR